ncbi:MAG: SLBB domain-containing protein [Pyrinomonadaceae bacterium]
MKRNLLLVLLALICLFQTTWAQDANPTPRTYLVGPGDEITSKVLGEPQFDFIAAVDENGNIQLPFFDKPFPAMCKSELELRAGITKLLTEYLRTPQVGLSVSARRSRPPVTVSGEVHTQQQVTLTRKTRLWELITFSGGVTENAGGTIQVFRTQPPLCAGPEETAAWQAEAEAGKELGSPSRMYSISTVQQGKDESNPIIYPGDVIIVEKAKPIYIVGEVKGGQGGVLLKEGGLPLTRAIAMVGGVNPQAKTKDIKIYRVKPDSLDKEIISANLDLIKKNEQKDVMLEPYDIVEVNKAPESIAKLLLRTVTGAGTTGLTTVVTGGLSRAILY